MAFAGFVPKRRVITAIKNAHEAVVTAVSHGYSSDEYVRINVPSNYGMRLGSILAKITVINANTFSINHSTVMMNTFVTPTAPYTSAEVIPNDGKYSYIINKEQKNGSNRKFRANSC